MSSSDQDNHDNQNSKPKWTCGEWYVEDFYERMQRFRVKSTYKRGTSGTTICALGSPRPGRTEENNPYKNIDAEDMANATLIAAAPELYEALESIVDCVARCTDDDGNPTYEVCQETDFTEARKALNKARGESND